MSNHVQPSDVLSLEARAKELLEDLCSHAATREETAAKFVMTDLIALIETLRQLGAPAKQAMGELRCEVRRWASANNSGPCVFSSEYWCPSCRAYRVLRDLLALLETQRQQIQELKDSRVDHTQYDPPLATAASNKRVPTIADHYGNGWIAGSQFAQRFIPKRACEGAPTIEDGDMRECPHPDCGARVAHDFVDHPSIGFAASCPLRESRQAADAVARTPPAYCESTPREKELLALLETRTQALEQAQEEWNARDQRLWADIYALRASLQERTQELAEMTERCARQAVTVAERQASWRAMKDDLDRRTQELEELRAAHQVVFGGESALIAQLTQEREEARAYAVAQDEASHRIELDLIARAEAAESRLASLRDYVQHKSFCFQETWGNAGVPCRCGLNEHLG